MRKHLFAGGLALSCLLLAALAEAQDKPQGVQIKDAAMTKMYEPPLMIDGYNLISGFGSTMPLRAAG